MKRSLLYSVLLVLLLLPFSGVNMLSAMNYVMEGSPLYINYASEDYRAHDRNLDVSCDPFGNTYFANYDGVLRYDGASWTLIPTPGVSRITSVYADSTGRVYAGGYNVAGRLTVLPDGSTGFHPYIDDSAADPQRIGAVRHIYSVDEDVVFIAQQAIVVIRNDSVTLVPAEKRLISAFFVDEHLMLQTESRELMEYSNRTISKPLAKVDDRFSDVCQIDEKRFLAASNEGLRTFSGLNEFLSPATRILNGVPIMDIIKVTDNLYAVATTTMGVVLLDKNLQVINRMDESLGLNSTQINRLASDGSGSLWCATQKGIIRINLPSFFTRFAEKEGLAGEPLTALRHKNEFYVGTNQGLFILNEKSGRFELLDGLNQSCHQLKTREDGELYAATNEGLFLLKGKKATQLSHSPAVSLAFHPKDKSRIYVGGMGGVMSYRLTQANKLTEPQFIRAIGQAAELLFDREGNLWIETLFGEITRYELASDNSMLMKSAVGLPHPLGNKLDMYQGEVLIVSRNGFFQWDTPNKCLKSYPILTKTNLLKNHWWPALLAEDEAGRAWIAGNDGKEIQIVSEGKPELFLSKKLAALGNYAIRMIYPEKEGITWVGGGFGLVKVDLTQDAPDFKLKPEIYIRTILINNNLLMYDGMCDTACLAALERSKRVIPMAAEEFPEILQLTPEQRTVCFIFASNASEVIKEVKYSYRLEGLESDWSPWQERSDKEYVNLTYGKYTFHIKAKDAYGKESEVRTLQFKIAYPFYLKWYSWIAYILLLIYGYRLVYRWRTLSLMREKSRLERMVEERTIALRKAQNELIRQERLATIGQLSKGLVDRILNPLNYINNFASLSKELTSDLKDTLQADQSQLTPTSYEESMELIEMLQLNMSKIAEHGGSTTRILRAMEEMLKERHDTLVATDMNNLCKVNVDIVCENFKGEINRLGIDVRFEPLPEPLILDIYVDQLSKALLSLLNNALYALQRKAATQTYKPYLQVILQTGGEQLIIRIRDNGTGIDKNILNKIFDPFFTTKTTGEASGIGLYLSRETILRHQGTIQVESEKSQYTLFTVMLPIHRK